jgi:hypothetical protein
MKLPTPEQLRLTADWLDTYDKLALNVVAAHKDDFGALEAAAIIDSTEAQDGLRALATWFEAQAATNDGPPWPT